MPLLAAIIIAICIWLHFVRYDMLMIDYNF